MQYAKVPAVPSFLRYTVASTSLAVYVTAEYPEATGSGASSAATNKQHVTTTALRRLGRCNVRRWFRVAMVVVWRGGNECCLGWRGVSKAGKLPDQVQKVSSFCSFDERTGRTTGTSAAGWAVER